jgi:hypothetical protein
MSIRGLGTVGQVTVGCLGRRRDRTGGLQVGVTAEQVRPASDIEARCPMARRLPGASTRCGGADPGNMPMEPPALANQLGGPVTSLHGEAAQAVAPIPVES